MYQHDNPNPQITGIQFRVSISKKSLNYPVNSLDGPRIVLITNP